MAASKLLSYLGLGLSLSALANAYFLRGSSKISGQRADPLLSPGKPSGHAHIIFGGSNFGINATTATLQESFCTSSGVVEDKSAYWTEMLYFQWANGSFSSADGGAVIYYLFPDQAGTTTAFPPGFQMISGDPTLRSYNASSFAQQAVTFLCLDFNGVSTTSNGLPTQECPSGIRAQINFPSCWDGKNLDSPDHKSHVAFRSGGPDSGDCEDPNYPVNIPRIFLEIYWGTQSFDPFRPQAMNPDQPFVLAMGDPTGLGHHADFINGWDDGVLQKAVDGCHCNEFGDPQCCADQGIFTIPSNTQCQITPTFDEQITGTLSKLPGNNPVVGAGPNAVSLTDPVIPAILSPVIAYTGDFPSATGKVVIPASTIGGGAPVTASPTPVSSSTLRPPVSSPSPTNATSMPVAVPAPPATSTVIDSSPAGSKPTVTAMPLPPATTTNIESSPAGSNPSVTAAPSSTSTNTESSSAESKPTVTDVPVPSSTSTIIGNSPGTSDPSDTSSSPSVPSATAPSGTAPGTVTCSSPQTPPATNEPAPRPSTTMICRKRPTNPSPQKRSVNHFNRNMRRSYSGGDDNLH